jgi:hypothetical protein
LLAAENISDLPVTTGVNTAIHMAKGKSRTLLVDADFERTPVAKAFDIQPAKTKTAALKTCIENLAICSSSLYPDSNRTNLRTIAKKASEIYDKVIIYAPNISVESGLMYEKIADCTIIFTNRSDNQISKLLEQSATQPPIVMTPSTPKE